METKGSPEIDRRKLIETKRSEKRPAHTDEDGG